MSLRSRLKDVQEIDGVTFRMTLCTRYAVSRCGKVLGRTGRVLKPKTQGKYLIVSYQSDDGCIRHKYVHRLIAEVWVVRPAGRDYVNHMDGNTNNNASDNLEWCTAKHNTQHAIATGLTYNLPKKGQQGFQCRA